MAESIGSLQDILSVSKTFSISMSANGSINISFSTFDSHLVKKLKNVVDNVVKISGIKYGSPEFRVTTYAHRGYIFHFNLVTEITEKTKIPNTHVFETLNANVKDVYDSYLNYYPYLANYQESSNIYHVRTVDNIWGINGWSAMEILNRISLNATVNIPSALNYKLKSFKVSAGSSLISAIRSLFPGIMLRVYSIGDVLHVDTVQQNEGSLMFLQYRECVDIEEVSKDTKVDYSVIVGEQADPRYINGKPSTLTLSALENEKKITKKIQTNLLGREFMTINETSEETIEFDTDPFFMLRSVPQVELL